MKSQLFLIILISLTCLCDKPVTAQQILNGGFEEVYQDSTLYPPYVLRPLYWGFGWSTTMNCYPVIGEMSTDSYSGDWAVKLETINCAGQLFAGQVGDKSEVQNSLHFPEITAQILNARPDQIEFYYKYLPVNGDTAQVSGLLFNYPDSITIWDPDWHTYIDTVGIANGIITGTVENYTQYLFDFEYFTTDIPEYLNVYFSSNHNGSQFFSANAHAHAGTTLWVDDVELIYLSTSSEHILQDSDVRIYPNPVIDNFQVDVPSNISVQSIQVHDFSGRQVITLNPQNRFHTLNDLPAGMYFLTLHTANGNVVKKFIKD